MPNIEVSNGELVDKYTILKIKHKYRRQELELECRMMWEKMLAIPNLNHDLVTKLYDINLKLWELEDKIRQLDRDGDFGDEFIDTARNIYRWNDNRHAIKKQIDKETGSQLSEIKILPDY